MFKRCVVAFMLILFGVANVNAECVCVKSNAQVKCLTGTNANELFDKIDSANVKAGKYFILIDRSVAKAFRERFKDCPRIKDVSIKVFVQPEDTLKEAFRRAGGEQYYFVELELN